MRGAPGSKVNIKVYREGIGGLDFKMVREVIKIPVLKAKVVSDGSVAYIKIRVFNDKAASSVRKECEKLLKDNPDIVGLVLDLRWNPGGVFDQAKEVADLFLADGDIVSIKGRDSRFNKVFKATAEDIMHGLPLVVLINRGSASAAEIVAGALQDNRRALVVGTKSFGKGSVQEIIPLSDGTAIKLTTALYYTPSGVSIQAQGIIPDITVSEAIVTPVDEDKSGNIYESSLKGHLKQGDEPKADSSPTTIQPLMHLEEEKDFQLIRAIDVVKTIAFYSTGARCDPNFQIKQRQ
jgi:carboxyl-terminal processing protease